MAQCRGTTKKGDRCRRDAVAGGAFCGIHQDQEVRAREPRGETEWDRNAIVSAVLGVAMIGAIIFFHRGRR